jgi:hypothetical protein
MVVLAAIVLVAVQALIYTRSYLGRADDGQYVTAWALGGSAIVFSSIELIGGFCGLRLGFPAVLWLAGGVPRLAFLIAGRLLQLGALAFRALPDRRTAAKPTASS